MTTTGKDDHQPVLLNEALEGLNIKSNGLYLDATFGRGGHSRKILEMLGKDGQLVAIDKDPDAIAEGQELAQQDGRFSIWHGSYADVQLCRESMGLTRQFDGILLDLGVSSPQLDDPQRGFSFQSEGPLDMRMNPDKGLSAAQWLAQADDKEIAQVLKEYGEERFAKRIARAIVTARAEAPIDTTKRLAAIVAAANPKWEPGKDPATRSFQAIRIFINQELDDLKRCLAQVLDMLKPGGRLVVISFHSLEDRIIKRFIREQSRGDQFPPDMPVTQSQLNPRLRSVGKAVRATAEEVERNPRARSAVMRVAEKLA